MALIDILKEEQKLAMKAKDKLRLGTIRLALSAIKQREVDEQITLGDDDILAVLTKMVKQRRDSVAQFESAGRQDLADAEQAEIAVLEDFMPQPLTDEEVAALIESAIADSGAAGMQDMGKVMGAAKSQLQGKADMSLVSNIVKQLLSG